MTETRDESLCKLESAIQWATTAHVAQTDKQGKPYILHPLRVMLAMPTYATAQVGVLHDVIEDSDITLRVLRANGFSEPIVAAVDALTRREGEAYMDYVRRAGRDPLAAVVKVADLKDNLDASRGPIPDSLKERYIEALAYLTGT